MKKLKLIVIVPFFLILLSFIHITPNADTIESVTFFDALTIGYEIEYEILEASVIPEIYNESYGQTIMSGIYLKKGDIFRISITKDLNELGLTNYYGLLGITEPWAEFYLNNEFLTSNSCDMTNIVSYIVPITLHLTTGSKNTFNYLYDEISPNTFMNESGYLKCINKKKEFIYGEKQISSLGINEAEWEWIVNKKWGVTSKFEYNITNLDDSEAVVTRYFEIELLNEDIKVPYNWLASCLSLLIISIAVLVRKRTKT